MRQRFFTPRLRVKSYEELNAWLLDQCVAYAKAHRHPERRDQTVWEMFEAERASLVRYAGRFDEVPRRACVGLQDLPRPVQQQQVFRRGEREWPTGRDPRRSLSSGGPWPEPWADRIELRQDGRPVGEHPRCFGRDQTVFDPWYYVPVLARKPGALRNSAPFKDRVLPAVLERIRRKLTGAADGDRQMVDILTAVLSGGRGGLPGSTARGRPLR